MSLGQDVHQILIDQGKILQAMASGNLALVEGLKVVSETIAAQAATQIASLDVLKDIDASLKQMAALQVAMAADLKAIRNEQPTDSVTGITVIENEKEKQ